MARYVLARVAQYAIVLWLAVTLNFALPRLMPGDPLVLLAGEDVGRLDAAQQLEIRRSYGLDQPVGEQYRAYLAGLLRGELGFSYHERRPVAVMIGERLPWTLLLVGTATVLSTALGVAAGSLAAWRRGRAADVGGLSLFLLLDSLPSFWLGMMLIALFAVQFRIFPLFGATSLAQGQSGVAFMLGAGKRLVLPVATLTLASAGGMFLLTRYAMIGVLGEDYILTARAKGAGERRVLVRHALRNAALPIATALLLRLGHLTGGATVVETVFSYPGMGRLMYQAVLSRDFPVVQGTFFLFTITVIAANVAADLVYPFLDPRLRSGGAGG